MKIINNKEEFKKFYPYDNKKNITYPKEYPCIAKWEHEGGGLVGEYKQVYVAYYPKNISANDAFFKGLNYSWEPLR